MKGSKNKERRTTALLLLWRVLVIGLFSTQTSSLWPSSVWQFCLSIAEESKHVWFSLVVPAGEAEANVIHLLSVTL